MTQALTIVAAPATEPDAIDQHFAAANVFIDRAIERRNPNPNAPAARRKAKVFSVASLHSMWPPPVAVAEFAAGGETIRMSFWQPAGKPWRFDAARRLVAQVIGNARSRQPIDAKQSKTDKARLVKAKKLADRPGTEGEGEAAKAAVERISASLRVYSQPRYNAHPPATDFINFYVEHDGQRYEPGQEIKRVSQPKRTKVSTIVSAPALVPQQPLEVAALLAQLEERLGPELAEFRSWKRVRARAARLDVPKIAA
jgi:hypothetical protein